jgi:hypothetical protein
MDRWIDRQTDGQAEGQTDSQMRRYTCCMHTCKEMDSRLANSRQGDIQTEKRKDIQINRWTDRHMDGQTDIWMDRQTYGQTD